MRAFQENAFQFSGFQNNQTMISTGVIQLPVDCVMAGDVDFEQGYEEQFIVTPRNTKYRQHINPGGSLISQKPSTGMTQYSRQGSRRVI